MRTNNKKHIIQYWREFTRYIRKRNVKLSEVLDATIQLNQLYDAYTK